VDYTETVLPINFECEGWYAPLHGGDESPSNTVRPRAEAYVRQVSCWSVQLFGHSAPTLQTHRTMDRYHRVNRFTNGCRKTGYFWQSYSRKNRVALFGPSCTYVNYIHVGYRKYLPKIHFCRKNGKVPWTLSNMQCAMLPKHCTSQLIICLCNVAANYFQISPALLLFVCSH